MRFCLLLAAAAVAFAQTPPAKPEPTKPEPAKREQSPEMKAYSEAMREKDPQKKAELQERFLQQYPNAPMTVSIRRQIFGAAVKASSKERGRLLATADRLISSAKGSARAETLNMVAWTMFEAGVFPADAERFAKQSVKQYKFRKYAADQRASAELRKRPVPTDAELKQQFDVDRAAALDTLGQIYVKNGDVNKGRKILEQAVRDNPSATGAITALADIAVKAGKSDSAFEYFAKAYLLRPNKDLRPKLESAFAALHGGSTAGLEEALDLKYKSGFHNPVHAEPYHRGPRHTGRTVLAELYTGAGCPPCVAADLAYDGVLERYSRNDVVVVMYHENIPRPDPMTNSDTIARWAFQKGQGVPTRSIDGKAEMGGGGRDYAAKLAADIFGEIDKRLETAPGADITLAAARQGKLVSVKAKVGGVASKDAELRVLLLERVLRYSGENGIRYHTMVVRAIANFPLDAASESVEHTFDPAAVEAKNLEYLNNFEKHDERHNKDGKFRWTQKMHSIDPAKLAVAAFVQDTKTREVLQAAYTGLDPETAATQ